MHVDSDQGTPWLKRCQARLLRKLLRAFVKSTDLNWRDIVQIARECTQIAENNHQCTGPHPGKVEKKLFSQIVEATRSVDADEHGRAYRSIGVGSHHAFLEQINEDVVSLEDGGLPAFCSSREVRYAHPMRANTTMARWRGLQDGRERQTRLVVIDLGYNEWNGFSISDSPLNHTSVWEYHNQYYMRNITKCLLGCLRVHGCFDPDGRLASDSGGWYLFTDIIHEVISGKPAWAQRIQFEIQGLYNAVSPAQTAIVLFQAFFPICVTQGCLFQGAFEQRGIKGLSRLFAVRAVSKHAPSHHYDPYRFIAQPRIDVQSAISGLFHLTSENNLFTVLSKGLIPGRSSSNANHDERPALHISGFSAFEKMPRRRRGDWLAEMLREAVQCDKRLMQIALHVHSVWDDINVSVLNGCFVCHAVLRPNVIESIVMYRRSPERQDWVGEFLFEKRLEKQDIKGFDGKGMYTRESVATLMASCEMEKGLREQRRAQICAMTTESEEFRACLKTARTLPLRRGEADQWPGLATRRCPSCLMSVPSACAKCPRCHVTYIG